MKTGPQAERRPCARRLGISYADPRELLMDVQRDGADAEVIATQDLRVRMRDTLVSAFARYSGQ